MAGAGLRWRAETARGGSETARRGTAARGGPETAPWEAPPARWRAVPATATPVCVPAAAAPRRAHGFDVGETAFAAPAAGWAVVGAPGVSRLLYTDNAGATWTPQLAWHGGLLGRLTAFDARRAALLLMLPPGDGDVNGYPVAGGGWTPVIARTEDAGATWTLVPVPDPPGFTGMFHFLTPHRLWLLRQTDHLPTRTHVAHTGDGGITWNESAAPEHVPFARIVFTDETAGLLVAPADDAARDALYVTTDTAGTWTRQPLDPPADVPRTAETSLDPVARPGAPLLLLLQAGVRQASPQQRWVRSYAYLGTDDGRTWSGPHRLPTAPTWTRPDLAVLDRDGRVWAASGHDVWTAGDLDGPWEHRSVPLPADQLIADLAPAGAGALWLTTTRYPSPGTRPSGLLYRSEDGGAHWTRLTVEAR
jgi:photosystem II stability/assembly factor-like uncharacterized protein